MPMQLSGAGVRQVTLAVCAALVLVAGAVLAFAYLEQPGPMSILVARLEDSAISDDRWHEIAAAADAADVELVEIVVIPGKDEAAAPDVGYLSAAIGRPTVVLTGETAPAHTPDVRVVVEDGTVLQAGTTTARPILFWLAALAFLLALVVTFLTWRAAPA